MKEISIKRLTKIFTKNSLLKARVSGIGFTNKRILEELALLEDDTRIVKYQQRGDIIIFGYK